VGAPAVSVEKSRAEGTSVAADQIVVTGLGMTSPLGGDVSSSWSAMLAGRSGVKALREPRYAQLPVRIAAELAEEPAAMLGRVEARRWDRVQQVAVLAARQAWTDAGLVDAGLDPARVGVVVGTGIGGLVTTLGQYDTFRTQGWDTVLPYTVTMTMPNAAAAAVSLDIGARGGAHAPVSACATGAEAIGQALSLLRTGRLDVVVCGGAEAALHPFTVAGFAAMRALSRRNDAPAAASRPFDADRDGFVLGEGAGMIVLETAGHARKRRVRAHAELAGAGFSSDAYHVTRADPDGSGPMLAIRRALDDAGVGADQVVHVNAHATSTQVGDLAEARAVAATVGNSVPVTATKSMTGHLLGGAGAIEAIATILALREGTAPPTINLDRLDPEIELNVISGCPGRLGVPAGGGEPVALSNSFGFGGHNVSLALRPAPEG
jgi:3-oxoacyl-[acyl-carrier-protein] synthase II